MSIGSYVHGGQAVPVKLKRVFLRTGTAYEGWAVNYNSDAVGVSAENEAIATGSLGFHTAIDGWCDARRVMVEAPGLSNQLHFAGVIARESDGVVGPNWISIYTPGSICRVYSTVVVSSQVTGGVGEAKTLSFLIAESATGAILTAPVSGSFYDGGFWGEGTALMLAEGAASLPSGTYLKMAQLMEGPPSGGVVYAVLASGPQGMASHTTPLIPRCGVIIVSASAAESCAISIAAGAPPFPGARLEIRTLSGTSAGIHISGANVYRVHTTSTATVVITTGDNAGWVVAGIAALTAPEGLCLEAFNSAWVVAFTRGTVT